MTLAVNSILTETKTKTAASICIPLVSSTNGSARISGLTIGIAGSPLFQCDSSIHLQVLQVLRGRRLCRGPVPTRSHLSGPGIVDSKVLNSPIFCSWYLASDGRILPKQSGQM